MSLRTLAVCLALFASLLFPAGVRGESIDPIAANALWVAQQDGAMRLGSQDGTLLLEIRDVDDVRAVAVDLRRRTLWAFAHGNLYAYDLEGHRLFSTSLGVGGGSVQVHLAVVPADGAVWLAAGRELRNVSSSGQLLAAVTRQGNAASLEVDPAAHALWIAAETTVEALDATSGVSLQRLDLPAGAGIADASPQIGTGAVWVALKDQARLYGPAGELLASAAVAGARQIAGDGGGGAWVATNKSVSHLSSTGGILATAIPLGGTGTIERLAAAGDGTIWVANQDSVAHLGADGSLLQQLSFRPPVRVRDLAVNGDGRAPEVVMTAPPSASCLADATPTLEVAYTDVGWGVALGTAVVTANGAPWPATCDGDGERATCELTVPLPDGVTTLAVSLQDYAGNRSAAASTQVVVDTQPPQITIVTPAEGAVTDQPEIDVTGTLSEAATLSFRGEGVPTAPDGSFVVHDVALDEGDNTLVFTAVDCAGHHGSATLHVRYQPPGDGGLPPDPATVAPAVDTSIATDIATSTAFLFSATPPVQTGVAPGTIDSRRIAVLRGRVTDRAGEPLPGVAVTVLGHAELGATKTRLDGVFDLAVNGGGSLVVRFDMPGYFPAQRSVDTPWRDFKWLDTVVLVQPDAAATVVESGLAAAQVARGSAVSDQDGTRVPTLVFQPGTSAELVMPGGGRQPVQSLTVRVTEYTVGANGPSAMPGPLPIGVAYTHAVEMSADEAIGSGATSVAFSQPVAYYVDNFLGFAVGSVVPVGYYDRAIASWLPSDNGRVVKVLATDGGQAVLDVTGGGAAATPQQLAALGITPAELAALSHLYAPGQTLWRVAVTHFTPWDCNWPYGPPDDAEPPEQPDPEGDDQEEDPCQQEGSIIECQNQTLGETIPIPGTPYRLNYRSDRVPGRRGARTLDIALSGSTVPASLKRIELRITVAGTLFERSFAAAPNQHYVFTWNSRDAYTRPVSGRQPVTIEIGYVYPAVYQAATSLFVSSWSRLSGIPASTSRPRSEVTLWQVVRRYMGTWTLPPTDLAGWSIDPYHYYDEYGATLFLGDGDRASAGTQVTNTVAGGGQSPVVDGIPATSAVISPGPLTFAADGTLFLIDYNIIDSNGYRVRRVTPDGLLYTVAGGGTGGDGGLATQARLADAFDVALGADGTLFIADRTSVRMVDAGGIIHKVYPLATTGPPAVPGEQLVAVDTDAEGNLYIADYSRNRIVRLDRSGREVVIAGTGAVGHGGDGGPASNAQLNGLMDLVVSKQGTIYVIDNRAIRRITPDGIINTLPLFGENFSCSPFPFSVPLCAPRKLTLGPDGDLYVGDNFTQRVHRINADGHVTTVAGNPLGTTSDGAPATGTRLLGGAGRGLAFDPDGRLHVSDLGIRKIGFALPGYSVQPLTVAARDGRSLFLFDQVGRHVRTTNTLTGAVRFEFGRDAAGRLASIRDAAGNVTTIERDAAGRPAAIVSPRGVRTVLAVDANGYLASVTNEAGQAVRLEYTADGLLTSLLEPGGGSHEFTYDVAGRLSTDRGPAGGTQRLTRTTTSTGYLLDLASATGRHRGFAVDDLANGDRRWTKTLPSGLSTTALVKTSGSEQTTWPDGMVTTTGNAPDPRFGLQSPVAGSWQVRTPAGLTLNGSRTRTVVLAEPRNPLSLRTLRESTTQNGRTYTAEFDATLRKFTLTSPAGRRWSSIVDVQGRPIELTAAGLAPVSFEYGPHGELVSMRQGSGPEAHVLTFGDDGKGRLASVADAVGRAVLYERDAAGRVTALDLPSGRIGLARDADGNMTGVTPPGRPRHDFEYSPAGRMTLYSPPGVGGAGAPASRSYDLDGRLMSLAQSAGPTATFGYDPAGRLAEVRTPDAFSTFQYSPATGHLTEVSSSSGNRVTFTYDGFLPRSTSWTGDVAGAIQRTFNQDFRPASITANGASAVTFAYDPDGLLTRAGTLTFARHPVSGLVTGGTLDSVTTAYAYNSLGELTGISAAYAGAGIFSSTFTRDAAGRIVGKVEDVLGSQAAYSYGYDPSGRLASVDLGGSPLARFGYDVNGNRTSETTPTQQVTADYDQQDRLVRYDSAVYDYAPSGDLRTRTQGGFAVAYEYDHFGALRSVTLADGVRIDYVNDPTGLRIGKRVDGQLVQGFLYEDSLRIAAELDGQQQVVSRFVYGIGRSVPDYMVKGGSTYRIVHDHLGSPRLVVRSTDGFVAQRLEYDAFGRVLLDTNPGFQPFGFAGGIYDPQTKLVRFGARDYDPAVGRWTRKDPAGMSGGDTNFYGYGLGDPLNSSDLSGLGGCTVDFPGYPITVPGTDTSIPLNHAGVVAYDDQGNTRYYEYGRYPPGNDGNVRRRPVPDLEIGPDGEPTDESWQALRDALRDGPGKGHPGHLVCHDDADFDKIVDFAEETRRNPPKYSWNPFHANTCATFAADAVAAGREDD